MAPVSGNATPKAPKQKPNVKTDVLLEVIKQYPYLYDKRHPMFKDNTYKDETWTKLGLELGIDGM